MEAPRQPRVVGLTGGIASGKSTVSGMFRALGARIVDADLLAREVVLPGTPGLAEVTARFPGVLGSSGQLDRAALAARIFANPLERAALNALLHPRIQVAAAEQLARLAAQGPEPVLYDAALLIENGLHQRLAGVILVHVPREVQRARLCARDGLSAEQAELRLAAQMPLEDKLPHATWTVDNAGGLEATQAQVARIWSALRAPALG